MHTHFFSATTGIAVLLYVLIFGTLWRLLAGYAANSQSPLVAGLGRAAAVQL
jgi:hypothetical protein